MNANCISCAASRISMHIKELPMPAKHRIRYIQDAADDHALSAFQCMAKIFHWLRRHTIGATDAFRKFKFSNKISVGCSICTQTLYKCRIHPFAELVRVRTYATQSTYVRWNECTRSRCRWCAIYIQSGLFLFTDRLRNGPLRATIHEHTRTANAKIAFSAIPKSLEPSLV